jgi:DNA-binding NarL/FixJ family response regulator
MTREDRDRRNQQIRDRLAEGTTCKQIAEELCVSLSVVSRVALSAGYRSRQARR